MNVGDAKVLEFNVLPDDGEAGEAFPREARNTLRQLGGCLQRDRSLLEADWLSLCAANFDPGSDAPDYAAALRRSLPALAGALRLAHMTDAELHVIELVSDLRVSSLAQPAVIGVLESFARALARRNASPDWSRAAEAVGRLCVAIATRLYEGAEGADHLLESNARPRRGPDTPGLVGQSPHMLRLRRQLQAIAHAPGPVLIVGPSGTGKEVVARAIHEFAHDDGRPFMAINCAALPHDLIESELFGHEKGAFTGSQHGTQGLMRAAADGTLFLDEVTEMPPATQAKLLRALEQRSVRPVGGVREWPIRARVVGATNRDPLECMAAGTLRADLYYRMCVHRIDLAPLSARRGDIPALVQHFLNLFALERPRVPRGFSAVALQVLSVYSWPGNIRELRNVVEHACAFAPATWVEPEHLPEHVLACHGSGARAIDLAWRADLEPDLEPLRDVERRHICRAMQQTRGNKAQAARVLGLSRHQLYVKLERLGIVDWQKDVP